MSLEELFSMAKSVMRRFSLYIKWTASGKHYKWLPITIKEPKKYFLKLSLLFKPNTPVQWWPMNSNERKFTFKRENKKIVTVMHPTRFKSGLYLLCQFNWCINIQYNWSKWSKWIWRKRRNYECTFSVYERYFQYRLNITSLMNNGKTRKNITTIH